MYACQDDLRFESDGILCLTVRLPVVDSYDQMKVHATVTEARLRSFCKADQ